jgi:hypothetical protein
MTAEDVTPLDSLPKIQEKVYIALVNLQLEYGLKSAHFFKPKGLLNRNLKNYINHRR